MSSHKILPIDDTNERMDETKHSTQYNTKKC